jgi:hypothetical protein
MKLHVRVLLATALQMALATAGVRAQQSTQDLAAAAQNPVAAMYSLPFQNNIYGGVGPQHDATANVLNIQPVIPITVGDWNIISRTIAPLIYLPGLATGPSEITEQSLFSGSHFGLGDINQTFYFSPAKATELIWGIGPSFNLPTGDSHVTRLRQIQHGPGRGGAGDAEAVGDRDRGAPTVVGGRSFESPGCEPIPDATLRQLQHGGGLVSGELADHYRELAGAVKQVGSSNRRRHRQDFPDRRAADECLAAGLRLRAVANGRTAMGRSRPTAIPVPAITARLHHTTAHLGALI